MVQDKIEIKRALISVYDKGGLPALMKRLNPDARGIEIISSGGTAKEIAKLGYKVIDAGTYTGHPESPDGLVKTLHPKIHAGLLLDPEHINPKTGQKEHEIYLREHSIPLIDLFVGNLYPFKKTVEESPGDYEKITEMIDIGGPAMIRAAAKRHKRVASMVDLSPIYLDLLIEGPTPEAPISTNLLGRLIMARKAYEHTHNFDGAIVEFFNGQDLEKMRDWYLGGKK